MKFATLSVALLGALFRVSSVASLTLSSSFLSNGLVNNGNNDAVNEDNKSNNKYGRHRMLEEVATCPCDVDEFFCDENYNAIPPPASIDDLNDVLEINVCFKAIDKRYRITNILEGNMDRESAPLDQCPIRVDNTDQATYKFVQGQDFTLFSRQQIKKDVVRNYNPVDNSRKICAMDLCKLTTPIDPSFLADKLETGGKIHLTFSGVVEWLVYYLVVFLLL